MSTAFANCASCFPANDWGLTGGVHAVGSPVVMGPCDSFPVQDRIAAPCHFGYSSIRYDRLPVGNAQERILRAQPLNVPFGSLKRSSPCDTLVAGATDVVLAADVCDEEVPHNSRTVGETVGVRSST